MTVKAPATDVYAAYTDADKITQWLCEGAAIDIASGEYALWGPSIPEVPNANSGHMSLLEAIPGALLRFSWQLLDDLTTVTITFQNDDDKTQASFEHTGIEDNDWAWTVASFWTTQAENMRAWIERGVVGPRFDFSTIGPGDIEVSAEIDAPASEVFKAIIEPDIVERWMMTEKATIEPVVGGVYDLAGWVPDGPVEIVDLEADEKLSYSWRSDWVGHETLVTWELAESEGKTRLTLMHSGFAPDARHDSYRSGWHGFLVQIKYLIEEGLDRTTVGWEVLDAETAEPASMPS